MGGQLIGGTFGKLFPMTEYWYYCSAAGCWWKLWQTWQAKTCWWCCERVSWRVLGMFLSSGSRQETVKLLWNRDVEEWYSGIIIMTETTSIMTMMEVTSPLTVLWWLLVMVQWLFERRGWRWWKTDENNEAARQKQLNEKASMKQATVAASGRQTGGRVSSRCRSAVWTLSLWKCNGGSGSGCYDGVAYDEMMWRVMRDVYGERTTIIDGNLME